MRRVGLLVLVVLLVVVGGMAGTAAASESAPDAEDYDDILDGMEGDGSEGSPYNVTNVTELQAMNGDLTANYTLGKDIDASYTDEWNVEGGNAKGFTPIGNLSEQFTGTFNGSGNAISDLYINRSSEDYIGLFGYVVPDGTIENVGLENVSINGGDLVGGLVGFTSGEINESYATGNVTGSYDVGGLIGENQNGNVNESYATGNVTSDDGQRVGGLIGDNKGGTVNASYATSNVTASNLFVGGLVGRNSGEVNASYATGNVTGTNRAGGLVGENDDGTVNESYATGNVTGESSVGGVVGNNKGGAVSESYATGSVNGSSAVGGLVGNINNGGTVSESYATGSVNGSDNNVGGLVGDNNGGTVSESYATGSVNGSDNVGGLVGWNRGEVSESHATGSVEGSNSLGGLVGQSSDTANVNRSYATGSVEGSERLGGLVGSTDGTDSDVSESYAIGSVNGSKRIGGLVGQHGGQNDGGTVSESYATGSVNGSEEVGGLVGTIFGGSVTTSYWDVNTTSQDSSEGLDDQNGLTTEEMKGDAAEGNMTDFDFATTWNVVDGFRDGAKQISYPYLVANQQEPEPGLETLEVVYAGGEGTETNPYEIKDWHHLTNTRKHLDANFTVNNDLVESTDGYETHVNTSEGFKPIGDETVGFTGTFNGSDNTISSLTINRSNDDYVGLLGNVSAGGVVENVTLEAVDIHGNSIVGGLVGNNDGGSSSGATIRNSSATGSVTGDSNRVGGLVGQNEESGSHVERSYATVTVNGHFEVGGLVGINRGGTVSESYATGSVEGATNNVGGLVGTVDNAGTVSESFATGAVNGGGDRVGGLVGSLTISNKIENSSATGDVTGDEKIGGLVGENAGSEVAHAYAAGEVDGNETDGGLIGDNTGTVTDSYWDTDRTGKEDSAGDATGLETVDMIGSAASDNMAGFDFDDTWNPVTEATDGADGDGYPVLSALDSGPQILVPDVPDDDNGGSGGGGGSGSSGGGGAGSSSPTSDETTIITNPTDGESGDESTGDSTDTDRPTPDTSISVTNPSPGQTIIIEDGVARLADDTEADTDGSTADTGTASSPGNIRPDRLSIDINTDQDFNLDITTYESDLTPSSSLGNTQEAASIRPFAAGGTLSFVPSTNEDQSTLPPEDVRATADAFEAETESVSAGYVDINHTLEPEGISGATFEFSIRQSYLDELGADIEAVELNHERSDGWEVRETEYVGSDETHAQFEATLPEFSKFAFGTGAPVMDITDRTLETETITTGDAATATVTVENRGLTTSEDEIELIANGEIVATETVAVEPGGTADLQLSFTPEEAGQYDLNVGGQDIQQLTVELAAVEPAATEPDGFGFWWLLIVAFAIGFLVMVLWRRRYYVVEKAEP